jgi:DNA-binding response OmpR family regulator
VSKKIMIAEDDDGILDAMKIMLEMHGYEVVTTIDGRAVLDLLDEMPDLLLLDIWMSGMDGREICKNVKTKEKTKNIPIIMISASRDVAQNAKDCGADDYLAKPFEMDELIAKIEQYTE